MVPKNANKMPILTTYRNNPVLWPFLLSRSPSLELEMALSMNMGANRMISNGIVKKTSVIQF